MLSPSRTAFFVLLWHIFKIWVDILICKYMIKKKLYFSSAVFNMSWYLTVHIGPNTCLYFNNVKMDFPSCFLQDSGTMRMSPGLSCPRLWSQTATSSPSSATSSTRWPSLWRPTRTTPERTSCGALKACDCMRVCRTERWWVWTTASSSSWFSSSWTSHRVLRNQCLPLWRNVLRK